MKKAVCLLCFVLCAFLLCSCGVGDAVLSAMGFDTHDYAGEKVIDTLDTESDEVRDLCEMIKLLTVNNPILPEFTSSGDAISVCQDSVLNYMLCTGFAKYTGNPSLLEDAEREYPELRLITVIPSEDYENCVYTYFGGNAKISHNSSELFTYLEKVNAYTAVTVPIESNITVSPISCEKTARTYRFTFRCSLGDVTSPLYKALIVRREDGSCYFMTLENAENS